jgi:hypothetical protein
MSNYTDPISRPVYGGSPPQPGREVAWAAADVASIADALGIDWSRSWAIPAGRDPQLPIHAAKHGLCFFDILLILTESQPECLPLPDHACLISGT